MEFVVLIVVLSLRGLLGLLPGKRHDRWFLAIRRKALQLFRPGPRHLYQAEPSPEDGEETAPKPSARYDSKPTARYNPKAWFSGTGAFFFAVVLPVAALSLLMSVLEEMIWGIPAFAASILVLLYSLGRKESAHWLTRFQIAWRQKDIQGAYQYAAELLPEADISNEKQLHQRIFSRILMLNFQDFFLVTFWFMLLGAEGALLARLVILFCEPDDNDERRKPCMKKVYHLRYLFEWLPVKLVGLSFMLTGHFVYCSGQWIATLFSRKLSHEQVLTRLAVGAMGEKITDNAQHSLQQVEDNAGKEEQLQEVEALLRRSSVLWVIAIAVAVVLMEL